MSRLDWNLMTFGGVMLGLFIGIAAAFFTLYTNSESSEAELRSEIRNLESDLRAEMQRLEVELKAEMQRIEAERKADRMADEAARKADMAELLAQFDRFIERVDSRLDDVEQEQARLDAVNELLARQTLP